MEPVTDRPPKTRLCHPERIKLTPDAAGRIDTWIAQAAPRILGRRLIRADLVNWLVISHAVDLNETELTALHAAYFDPIKSLEWALREAKAAHARGDAVDVREVVNQSLKTEADEVPRLHKVRRPRRTKEKPQDGGAKATDEILPEGAS